MKKPSAGAPRGRGGMERGLRRSQLLAVAEAMILRDGISSLSMSQVAAEAGVARTVVYSHFGNVSALLLAVVERHWALIDELFAAEASAESFEARLRHHAKTYLGESAHDRLALRRLLDAATRDETVNAAYQRRQTYRRRTWSRLLERERGLSPPAAALIATSLIETLSALGSAVYASAAARDEAAELFVRGMLGMVKGLQ